MNETPPDAAATYEVVCPHCKKPFSARPLTGGAERYQGFKCPHCRLFVSFDRADAGDGAAGKP